MDDEDGHWFGRAEIGRAQHGCGRHSFGVSASVLGVFDDRADGGGLPAGAFVSRRAGLGEGLPQRKKIIDGGVDLGDAGVEQVADCVAGRCATAADLQHFADVIEVESEGAGPADESQQLDVLGGIEPVNGLAPVGLGQQALGLIDADGLARESPRPERPARWSFLAMP